MKRKLVYHFFFYKNWKNCEIYEIHFKCLEYYRDCFDEAYFALSFEDLSDIDTIIEVKNRLNKIFYNINRIEYEIVENTPLCEVPTFKKEIVDRLDDNDLIFFAHSKGVMDVHDPSIAWNFDTWANEYIFKWVFELYFCSLNQEKKNKMVSSKLIKEPNLITFGSLPIQVENDEGINFMPIYKWMFCGTFFWIHSKRLKFYLYKNKIDVPKIVDRYYAENFLGNLFPMKSQNGSDDVLILASGIRSRWVIAQYITPDTIQYLLDYILDGDKEEFDNFVNEIKEGIKKQNI